MMSCFYFFVYDYLLIEQHEKLKTEFEVWKVELEQIDDVCISGIKI